MNRHPNAHESLTTCTCLTILNHWSEQTLQMETSTPVPTLAPYETPKAKRMAADADLSSGTGLAPCSFEPWPFE